MDLDQFLSAVGRFFFKRVLGVGLLVVIFGLILFRIMFVNFVDNYELGYAYDLRDGKIMQINRTGYVVTLPFVQKVHTVDLRPMQVCINANKRVLNCKLVEFNPKGLDTFLQWHGRKNYEYSTGEDGRPTLGGFNDILTSYAYDGSSRNYPFLTIIRELKPGEVAAK